jgi:HSP20 family protein
LTGTHPTLNVRSDKDNIYVEALAPGLNMDGLDISVEQGVLRISGEKAALSTEIKPEDFHRRERAEGRFIRALRLPAEVDSEKVTAEYKNGVLRITLPKTEAAKPRQIQVKVA